MRRKFSTWHRAVLVLYLWSQVSGAERLCVVALIVRSRSFFFLWCEPCSVFLSRFLVFFEVGDCLLQGIQVLFERAESVITKLAEQGPYLTGVVVVIDVGRGRKLADTNSAFSILLLDHLIEVFPRESVDSLEPVVLVIIRVLLPPYLSVLTHQNHIHLWARVCFSIFFSTNGTRPTLSVWVSVGVFRGVFVPSFTAGQESTAYFSRPFWV